MRDTQKIETLLRTGKGTVMGDFMRRYWVPALLESEVAEPDGAPVRVQLLGERLVAARMTDGTVAVLQESCPHRGASLFFGRNEEQGLRCSFHGWKYDASGQCVDMPSEPATSRFKDRVCITAYPTVVSGGVVWAYLGAPAPMPEPPRLEWSQLPADQRYISKRIQKTNYLQALEGGIDSSHVSFLHRYDLARDPMHNRAKGNEYLRQDTHPKFEVAESDGGLLIAARRDADQESYYWRITQFILPWYTLIPPFGDHPMGGHAWVPIDDEHCWVWSINFHPHRALSDEEVASMASGLGIHATLLPGTFEPVANAANDYLVDRAAQKEGLSFSGIAGLGMQDTALQESAGPIQDRSVERLGTSDIGIVMARRRLLKAAQDVAEGAPAAGNDPQSQYVRAAAFLLERGKPFTDARDTLVAGGDRAVVTL